MQKHLLALTLASMSFSSFAALDVAKSSLPERTYNFAELSLGMATVNEYLDASDSTGLVLDARVEQKIEAHDNLFWSARLVNYSISDDTTVRYGTSSYTVSADSASYGVIGKVGYIYPINEKFDVTASGGLGYFMTDVEVCMTSYGCEEASESGLGFVVGADARYAISDKVDAIFAFEYQDTGYSTESFFSAQANYHLTDEFSVGGKFETEEDATTLSIIGRYVF